MNAWRLAVGTLTVLPVRTPQVDRRVAGRAMALAPLVGVLLALPGVLLLAVAGQEPSPLLAAALVVGLQALVTRGLHLDGLADTADGLGSGKPALEALEVMRRGDVGPFGVVTLVLVLLVQVAALAQLLSAGLGGTAVLAALVVSRLALPLACSRGVPAARTEGLGTLVAGSVPRGLAVASVVGSLLAVGLGAVALGASGDHALAMLAVAPWGLVPALLLGWHVVRRLGGVTGDVLGALVETAYTGTLVALCLR